MVEQALRASPDIEVVDTLGPKSGVGALFGSLLPSMGVTNSSGEATLSLWGASPQSIRALYVKPKGDYWSFYQTQPVVSVSAPNVVILRPLSETYPNFPQQQVIGWGQRAMRLDQLPPD